MVGSYDPRVDRVQLKGDRIKHWMSEGASVSDTVHNLLVSEKIIDAKKINVLPKKHPPKSVAEEKPAEEKKSVEKAVPQEEETVSGTEASVASENAAE